MRNLFPRIVALLLIPCLITDLTLATAWASSQRGSPTALDQIYVTPFSCQALSNMALASSRLRMGTPAGSDDVNFINAGFPHHLAKPDLIGNIIGPQVTSDEEAAWRKEIGQESDEIREINPEIVKLVDQRAARLLERESDIRVLLEQNRVPTEQINSVGRERFPLVI